MRSSRSENIQSFDGSTTSSCVSILHHTVLDGGTTTQYCQSCEAHLSDNARFCSRCGHALGDTTAIKIVPKGKFSTSVDVQPRDVPTIGSRVSTSYYKVLGKLPMPAQHLIAAILVRTQDPEAEVSPTSHLSNQKAEASQVITWGWFPILTLTSTLGVLSVAYAYNNARNYIAGVDFFFWFGLALTFVPAAIRLLSPAASRFERISLLCVITVCFYLVKVIDSPLYFFTVDEFLHWRTADDILETGHLFSQNATLPVSPFYPGLEIVTNALSRLTGLNTFYAGTVVVGVARLVTILSLFLFYELIMKSARMAGIATLIYMGNQHFLFYDAQFAYGSLAVPLATFVLFAMARLEAVNKDHRWITFAAWLAIGAAVVTHHVTDFVLDGLLILWTVTYAFQHPARLLKSNGRPYGSFPLWTTLLGVLLSVAWISLPGNPVVGYLSSYSGAALDELGHVLTGTSAARHLFSDYAGQQTPLWERIVAASSVVLILLGLPFGLLCIWQRYRYNTLAFMLGIASLFYPISNIFRFTNNGSEISDRAVAFLGIPVSFVLAILIAQFWPTRRLSWRQTSLLTCAITVMFLGGAILGSGPSWARVPGPYLVVAGSRSIEPEGIQTAIWAHSYLGPANRMSTDLTNRILMSTYGDQRVVTDIEDNIDVTPVFFSSTFGPGEVSILKAAKVRYLVVDLRLSSGLPHYGIYFEQGERASFQYTKPIDLKALTKFSAILGINRVFDSGNIQIYDVGGLINAPEKP